MNLWVSKLLHHKNVLKKWGPMFYYEIDYPDSEPSPATTARIEGYLKKIDVLYDRITSCHVAVRIPHKHQKKHFFHVHIRLEIPGKNIIVDREPEVNVKHTNINIAVHDAFRKLTRKLEDYLEHRQERFRQKAKPVQGKLKKSNPDDIGPQV